MLAFARRQNLNPERSLGANISIVVRFPAAMGTVLVDRNQLEMAVLNLAVNARDAMPRGGAITVEVREQQLAAANAFALPAGRYAVLSIIDHGEGMDETTLQRRRSLSSRPKAWAKAPASASPWCTAWRNNRRPLHPQEQTGRRHDGQPVASGCRRGAEQRTRGHRDR